MEGGDAADATWVRPTEAVPFGKGVGGRRSAEERPPDGHRNAAAGGFAMEGERGSESGGRFGDSDSV